MKRESQVMQVQSPGLGRPPGGGHGNPLQYSCLENPLDRGARRAAVHGIAEGGTELSTAAGSPQRAHRGSSLPWSWGECTPSSVAPGSVLRKRNITTPKARSTSEIIDKLAVTEIKHCCSVTDDVKRMRPATDMRKQWQRPA